MAGHRLRVGVGNYIPDKDMPPHLNLAGAILHRALMDARLLKAGRKASRCECFQYSHEELSSFFRSSWCGVLLCGAEQEGTELEEYIR